MSDVTVSSAEQIEKDRNGGDGSPPTVVAQDIGEGSPSPLVTKNLKEPIYINGRKYGPGLDYVPANAESIWGPYEVKE